MSLFGAFSTLRPFGLLYPCSQQVPAFISRGDTHHTDARDLYQRRRELLPLNFASKSVIHENSLSSFTCRKPETWDRFFYFPSGGRHGEDFYVRKIQRLRPGLNPQTWVPEASMLTTRPPKPSTGAETWLILGKLSADVVSRPILTDFRKCIVLLEGSYPLPAFPSDRLALWWRWLWSVGGTMLIGEKQSIGINESVTLQQNHMDWQGDEPELPRWKAGDNRLGHSRGHWRLKLIDIMNIHLVRTSQKEHSVFPSRNNCCIL